MTYDWSEHVMEDNESSYPPTWKPEKGDQLSGKITDIRTYQDTPILEIDDESNGKHSLFVSQVKLRQVIPPANPQVGDHIQIQFLGQLPVGGGKHMNDYECSITKAGKPADYSEPF